METGFMNRITGLVIALVVGGLLVGGLLIPSIEGMTATEKTFENEGYFYIAEHKPTDSDVTIAWDHTNPQVISVNNTEISMNTVPNDMAVSVQMAPGMLLRYAHNATAANIRVSGAAAYYCDTTNGYDLTIVLTETGATITSTQDNSPKTYDYAGTMYYISNEGPNVMKNANIPAYINGDSELFIVGATAAFDTSIIIKIEGNIDDGFTASTVLVGGEFTVTYSEVEADFTTVSGYEDLYKLEKLTFTITNDNTSATQDVTYSYFMVPNTITAERTQHMDATQIAMFGVISILGIVALVVVAANGIRNKY